MIPGEVHQASVLLYDFMADPGVAIREVESSQPATLMGTLEACAGPVTQGAHSDDPNARMRYRLQVRFTPLQSRGSSPTQQTLTLIPENTRFPRVIVAIISQLAPPAFEVTPPGLTLSVGQDPTRQLRDVLVSRRGGDDLLLSVQSAPQNVTVNMEPTGGNAAVLHFAIDPPATFSEKQEVVLDCGPEAHPVVIPITYWRPE